MVEAKHMRLEVVTALRVVFDQDVYSISAPGSEGSLGILPGHMPIVARLATGVVSIRSQPGEEPFELFVSGGFMEVEPSGVVIMADIAEKAGEIDEARAEAAKTRAEARLQSQLARVEYIRTRASLQRAIYRLKVARHQRHH